MGSTIIDKSFTHCAVSWFGDINHYISALASDISDTSALIMINTLTGYTNPRVSLYALY
jgi:hypothetical protein